MVKGTNEMTSFSTLARAARLGSTRKRGVTLIEAVLYISIALALIVGGLVFFQQASLAQRTNSAVRNISAIASETRGLYQGAQSFSGVATGTLINAGAVPTSLVNAAGTALSNEWGGDIAITSVTPFATFTVTYENVPTAACTRLASADASGSGRVGAGIASVGFKNGAATGAYTPYNSLGDLLTPTLVAGYCSTAAAATGTAGIVDLQYTFTR
jgi:type II secretory pathway pseudopilin PulG